MAKCKFCDQPIAWGQDGDRWVPLVPLGEEGDHERTHVDADGHLRVLHRAVCQATGYPAVQIKKLAVPVPASNVIGTKSNNHKTREIALQHFCPTCGVNPGKPCIGAKGKPRHSLHSSRWKAA